MSAEQFPDYVDRLEARIAELEQELALAHAKQAQVAATAKDRVE